MSENTERTETAMAVVETNPLAKLNTLGSRLAKESRAKLDDDAAKARKSLEVLRDDATLPERLRQSVSDLVDQSSTERPDLGEMEVIWTPPRVMIAQPTTREEKRPEGSKNGALYTSEGKLLEQPWAMIPIYFYEEHVNFGEGGKAPVCRSMDGHLGSPFGVCNNCPHIPFGKQNGGRGEQRQSQCYSNIVTVALASDLSQVYTIQFGKTSKRAGTALLSWVRAQKRAWKQTYLIDTEKKTGNNNLYWIFQSKATGKDNPEDVQRVAKGLHDLYHCTRAIQLADWYSRPMQADQRAAAAEQSYDGSAFEAGMSGDGVEPDLDAAAPPVPSQNGKAGHKGSVRSSNKPM
jgi:hypothetical protein